MDIHGRYEHTTASDMTRTRQIITKLESRTIRTIATLQTRTMADIFYTIHHSLQDSEEQVTNEGNSEVYL